MKPLKPSAKERKRYLLVKGKIEGIDRSLREFLGVLGMSKVGLIWVKKSKASAVIGINREMLDPVRAGLCVSKDKFIIEKVSGTLKGLGIKQGKTYK